MSNILKQRLQAGQSVYTDHPAADALSAFIEHGLKDSERQNILGHLASCAECRQAVAITATESPAKDSRVAPASRLMLHFPAAMRWASAAAVLAVGVGIGVLSIQHRSSSSTIEPTPASAQRKPEVAEAQNHPAVQDQLSSPTHELRSSDEKKAVPVLGFKKRASNARLPAGVEDLNLTNRSSSVGVPSGNGPGVAGAVGGLLRQPEMQRKNSFAPVALPAPASQNGTTAQNFAAQGPPPSAANEYMAAATPTQSAPTVDVKEALMAQTKSGPTSSDQSVELMSNSAASKSESLMPYKAVGVPAISGAMRKSTVSVSEFVSWTITTAGRLQRRIRDGAVKLIEPAPGVIVRAVAAHGIEVWAGGSQQDLSAKQWHQVPALFHSSDAGETWTKVDGPWHSSINSLTLTAPGNVTVATQDGTWISRDAGKSWITE